MKRLLLFIIILSLAFFFGTITQRYWGSETNSSRSDKKEPLYWVAPMDPNYRRDAPGKSPMGMDLVAVYAEDEEGSSDKDIVKISPAVVQNLGVRTAEVQREDLSRQIDTVGYVTVDENRISHVHTYADGWIRKLLVKTTGEHVDQGELLLQLYSPTLINAQEEYLLAVENNNAALLAASRQKLLTLGMSSKQVEKLKNQREAFDLVNIFAHDPGIVSLLSIREGMYVRPEQELMTIEDLAEIWIIAEVFDQQASWVQIGQAVEASFPYLSDEKWQGKVDYVYPEFDATTRTLQVRLRFANPERTLKPNMYMDVTIFTDPKENVLTIPREALIQTSNSVHVIVNLEAGDFQARSVTVGTISAELAEITAGLSEGEKVVISGQFLIDSESNIKASFERMEGGTMKDLPMQNHNQDD
ncbi:MAG: efflux RND transporter periplasmic adaptor subunit [Gammaproteobacteria bacterium]